MCNVCITDNLHNLSLPGLNRTVIYSLVDSVNGFFSIDPVTGIVVLERSLDRESRDSYRLRVQATDRLGQEGALSSQVGDTCSDGMSIETEYRTVKLKKVTGFWGNKVAEFCNVTTYFKFKTVIKYKSELALLCINYRILLRNLHIKGMELLSDCYSVLNTLVFT